MTTIKGSIGHTVNTGNFENIRVEVSIEDDVRQNETVDQAFDRVYSKLEEQLVKRVKNLVDGLRN